MKIRHGQKVYFKGWRKTTSKPGIQDCAKNEVALILHHQIVDLVEKYQMPSSMLIKIDQTTLKHAQVSNQTMAQKGSKYVLRHSH